jgi:hypothetical protein
MCFCNPSFDVRCTCWVHDKDWKRCPQRWATAYWRINNHPDFNDNWAYCKQQKQQIDAATKADQLKIEEARIAAQKEIAAMQVGASAAAAKDKLQKQQLIEGTKIGADIAKHKAQMAMQMAQRASQKPKKE